MDEIASAIRELELPLWCIFVILWAMLVFKNMGGRK